MRVMDGYKLTLWFVSCSSMAGHLVLCVPTNLKVEEKGRRLTLVWASVACGQDPGVSLLRLLFNVDGKTPQIWLMLHTNVDEFGSQNDPCPILSGDGNGCLQRSPILCVDGFEEGTLVTPISR